MPAAISWTLVPDWELVTVIFEALHPHVRPGRPTLRKNPGGSPPPAGSRARRSGCWNSPRCRGSARRYRPTLQVLGGGIRRASKVRVPPRTFDGEVFDEALVLIGADHVGVRRRRMRRR